MLTSADNGAYVIAIHCLLTRHAYTGAYIVFTAWACAPCMAVPAAPRLA